MLWNNLLPFYIYFRAWKEYVMFDEAIKVEDELPLVNTWYVNITPLFALHSFLLNSPAWSSMKRCTVDLPQTVTSLPIISEPSQEINNSQHPMQAIKCWFWFSLSHRTSYYTLLALPPTPYHPQICSKLMLKSPCMCPPICAVLVPQLISPTPSLRSLICFDGIERKKRTNIIGEK